MATKVKKKMVRPAHVKSEPVDDTAEPVVVSDPVDELAPVIRVPRKAAPPVCDELGPSEPKTAPAPVPRRVVAPVGSRPVAAVQGPGTPRVPMQPQRFVSRPVQANSNNVGVTPRVNVGQPRPAAPQMAQKPRATTVLAPRAVPRTQTVTRVVPVAVRPGETIRVVRTSPRPVNNVLKFVLAAVPSFFGIMGLSQLYQGKTGRGLLFFMSGAIASVISSWYVIMPARLIAFVTHGTILPAYALSFLSSTDVSSTLASRISIDLMGIVAAIWALQLFDAMGPFIGKQTVAIISTTVAPKIPVALPAPRQAVARAPNVPLQVAPAAVAANAKHLV